MARNTNSPRQSRGDFILEKRNAKRRPASWMLQEKAAHNLTNNVAIISKHSKCAFWEMAHFPDKIRRNSPPTYKWRCKTGTDPGNTRFLVLKNIRGGLSGGSKRRFQSNVESVCRSLSQLKGVPRLTVEKSDNAQRKRGRSYREMEICLGLKSDIDHGLLVGNSIGGFPSPKF